MEALERIGAGVPVGALFLSREFLLGVALQVVVAAAAVMLLVAVQRVAARVARAVRRRRVVARPRTLPAVGRIAAPPRAARGLRLRARAPPSAAC